MTKANTSVTAALSGCKVKFNKVTVLLFSTAVANRTNNDNDWFWVIALKLRQNWLSAKEKSVKVFLAVVIKSGSFAREY